MRAKTVNFERGGDPLDSLDIGHVRERKIQKIKNEISAGIMTMTAKLHLTPELEDRSGKDRISIWFEDSGDNYYISFDLDQEEGEEVYTVGWHKIQQGETGNGDEIYFDNIGECIIRLTEWLRFEK